MICGLLYLLLAVFVFFALLSILYDSDILRALVILLLVIYAVLTIILLTRSVVLVRNVVNFLLP